MPIRRSCAMIAFGSLSQVGTTDWSLTLRKFMIVVDDTPECTNALRFAARRAAKTGGGVVMLYVIRPEEFQHWIGVAEVMRAEAREAAEDYRKGRVIFGTIGTSDSWNCAVDRVRFLYDFYGTACEEMEGDAVAQIAQSFGVPFLDVRIISNSILKNQDPWDLGTGPACQDFVLALLRAYWQ